LHSKEEWTKYSATGEVASSIRWRWYQERRSGILKNTNDGKDDKAVDEGINDRYEHGLFSSWRLSLFIVSRDGSLDDPPGPHPPSFSPSAGCDVISMYRQAPDT
jgi:hypothetical protein